LLRPERVRDDEERIGAEIGRLDAGNHLVLSTPTSASLLELMEATHLALVLGASDIALGKPGRSDLLQLLIDGEAAAVVTA
jgi:hypothetical protein